MDFGYFYRKQSSQYAFYRIPKQLFTEKQFDVLSIGAKLLYGMMIDRMELSQRNGWLDDICKAGFTLELGGSSKT
ncbi:MAG: replication initiator protein A [Lachnospiraceae bacterium]|nr:replication initiator protein A [Lachnospiraceae bacterium]